ncbi:thioesterase family protein [Maritalea mobilis]|uniref:acyl-CoA thioesterase n=1 Tax=Maritalea mobilis TaxID=483324 RepID=UPI001C98B497|nr:thioesterase family protein [Maritalea mobilis]MBY6202123.1 thioesterase family protein [Maritalea mobilis]
MTDLPAYGIETLRRPVQPAECDILGHMNVARYVDAVSDAMFSMMTRFGLSRAAMAERRLGLVAAHLEADYRAELLSGDVIVMQSRVEHVGTKSARFAHRLYRADTGALVFEASHVSVFFDLEARRATAFPDDIRAALEQLKTTKGEADAA